MKTKLLLLLLLANFSLYAQTTAIPDLNFEKKLISLGIDTGTPDGQILTSKISTITTLNISSSNISNLTGIEGFTALKDLDCSENRLITSVNLSKNIALEKASFIRCPLTSLDVTSNINLVDLNFATGGSTPGQEGSGSITILDLSKNPKLKILNCSNHKIASLNLSSNLLLENLDCGGTSIKSLDLSQNLALKKLSINNALFLKTIDLAKNTNLTTLDIGYSVLESINLTKNTALTYFYSRSAFDLQQIDLRNGKNSLITSANLNIKASPNLSCVLVDDVAFAETNWTGSKDYWTKFSTICETPKYTLIPDVEFEKVLILQGLDARLDGKVLTAAISGVKALNYRYTNYQKIRDLTGIEDFSSLETLETPGVKMTKLDVSKNTALKYLNCSAENLTNLDLSNNKNLITVDCTSNKIASLDLSNNTQLQELNFSSNNITEINLANNKDLTKLVMDRNSLSNIDLSNNLKLETLVFGGSFTNIDLSSHTALTYVVAYNSNITSLDLKKNTLLDKLKIEETKISTLDLSLNKKLTDLYISNNNILTEVNLQNGNNTLLTAINTKNNTHLDCIIVDDVDYSNTNWINKNNWTKYGLVCATDYTLIPDQEFEKALIERNLDLILDGKISTALAAEIKYLDLQQYSKISDLTGIEAFTSIETLLTPVNSENLKTLNLNQNTALKILTLNNSKITSLDLSKNKALTKLELTNNKYLGELNLQNQNNNLISSSNLNLTNNATLACILVDDVTYSNANWTAQKDSWASYTKTCSEQKYTLIPDLEFEKALIANGIDNIEDGKVLTARIAVEKTIDYRYSNYSKITDLTGIEDFTALEVLNTPSSITKLNVTKNTALKTLNCNGINLTSIDLANNKNLVNLNCSGNNLGTINLSSNTALETLNLNGTSLTSLDIQNNTKLTSLNISYNFNFKNINLSKNTNLETLTAYMTGIETIDVSTNTKLITIDFSNGRLTTLDVSNNPFLTSLTCQNNALKSLNLKNGKNNLFGTNLNFKGNSALTCIQVDDIAYSNSKWSTYKDAAATYNVDCTPYTLIPDSNFEDKLIALKIDKDGKNGKVATASIASVTSLDVSSSLIKDLTGIQDFTSLKVLNCSTNQLTSLNPASNPLLTELNVSNNKLTALDINKNLALTVLDCSYNTLTTLQVDKNTALVNLNVSNNTLTTFDVSKNQKLTALNVSNNNLSSLNVKNGFNVNMDWFSVNFTKNASLGCIQVDNAKYSNDEWNGKLDKTSFFTENCGSYTLIPDSNFEDQLIALKIDIDGKNGKVLTSTIATVKDLNVQLSDIKDLTGIEDFAALEYLNCQFNLLTSLNVSKNTKLIELYTHGNDLTTLDLSTNTALTTLYANKNKITALDLSKNSKLVYINVTENALKTLNLKNGNNINFTGALLNKNTALTCISVDNPAFATSSGVFFKDATASYSANCTLGIEDSIFNKAVLYPNPTKGEVSINNIALEKATVYNSLGQLVKTFVFDNGETNNIIDLAGLPRGVYYVYLINGDDASAKKIIVE
ncbi:T9SS type A sorting domain-containing protein [Flavobacterium sp. 17A]|uniref:T9SS type A sorting domain-containing protein n=1 Tax=Flavobacterium potami TaxID=2872310 RepID=A0A9X1HBB5_9FLAO|nr:T9SS type A sorting domain-containing protein [Flavobacterium potami]MBZ4035951.1 T9SS type A sorting domain-containing protein [Flavobacterium potami]